MQQQQSSNLSFSFDWIPQPIPNSTHSDKSKLKIIYRRLQEFQYPMPFLHFQ
jgi:hypothetical protein